MFRWALRKGIDKFERGWNYDASNMRDIGHGKACMRGDVGGTPVMFDDGRVPALVPSKLRSSDGMSADVAVRTA